MNRNQPTTSTPLPPRRGSEPDALDVLVAGIVEEDPTFAPEWLEFLARLDLQRKRKAAGISQKQLAETLGMRQSNLARLERDPSGVSLRRFRAYAAALGYRVDLVPIARRKPRKRTLVRIKQA